MHARDYTRYWIIPSIFCSESFRHCSVCYNDCRKIIPYTFPAVTSIYYNIDCECILYGLNYIGLLIFNTYVFLAVFFDNIISVWLRRRKCECSAVFLFSEKPNLPFDYFVTVVENRAGKNQRFLKKHLGF